jgi:3-isopropylmalate/(R)-2-methylmalate dehydratase small subunit
MLPKFDVLKSHTVPLLLDDVDTDQIIPARYLKGTQKTGLGDHLFEDWSTLPDGTPNPNFVLNEAECHDAQILLAGRNFGCGSSREHAAWAILGHGFRAVIARSFADIFHNNALKNGLLPVALDEEHHASLVRLVRADRLGQVTIDLTRQRLDLPNGDSASFSIDAFSKRCLVEGVDQLGYLLGLEDRIREYEVAHGHD